MPVVDPTVGLWGLFVSAFISSTIAPGGSEVVLAYLVTQPGYSPDALLSVATLGNTLGALTTWWLGWLAFRRFPLEQRLKGGQKKALCRVKRWGVPILLLSWLPVIGDGLCFAAGWLHLSLWKGIVAIIVGKLLRYAGIVYVFI